MAAGTVEAGAGAGEGAKRKRSDDMAALEADLEAEPQAGESCCTNVSHQTCLYSARFQLITWGMIGTWRWLLPLCARGVDLVYITFLDCIAVFTQQ